MARWSKRFNWHHRALDFDEATDKETIRRMMARRARLRQRAIDIADLLDEKVLEAVRGERANANPEEIFIDVKTPQDVARMFEVSQKIQEAILGDPSKNQSLNVQIVYNAPDPKYDFEQPEAMEAARRKAEAERLLEEGTLEGEVDVSSNS